MKRKHLEPDYEITETDPKKLNELGLSYYSNNPMLAFLHFQKAADQGNVEAIFHLGVCYDKAVGVDNDFKQAVKYYRLAADQGHGRAQFNLGIFYQDGKGVEVDHQQAVKYYQLAVDQGYCRAQVNLGLCYQNGEGVEVDSKQAIKYFHLAANQDFAPAQYLLAQFYERKNDIGIATEFYQKAAAQKHPISMNWISKKLAYDPYVIINHIAESAECFLPTRFLKEPVSQNGKYCGSAALAAAINYSGCLSFPVYASIFEKSQAGEDITQTGDIVLSVLINSIHFPTNGPQYDIDSFYEPTHYFKLTNCHAIILKENCTEEEYLQIFINAFQNNRTVVLSCEIETENEMPAQKKGLGTHWVWGLGYWKEPNGQYYLLVSHHGYYCAWPVHDLYESNKTPDINPRLNGGHLKKFRFSLFEVPVVKEREIMREIPRRAI